MQKVNKGIVQEERLEVTSYDNLNISELLDEVKNFKGGNIKGKIREWENITSDTFILDIVKMVFG